MYVRTAEAIDDTFITGRNNKLEGKSNVNFSFVTSSWIVF